MRYKLKIGPAKIDSGMQYEFELPQGFYQRWYKVEFQFKCGPTLNQIAGLTLTPGKYVYVKERWYHRVTEWIYSKFKRNKAYEAL